MNNSHSVRNSALYLVILIVLGVFLFSSLRQSSDNLPSADIGRVAELARQGQVKTIIVSGDDLTVELQDGKKLKSRKESNGSIVETLLNLGVPPEAIGGGQNQIDIRVTPPSLWANLAPLLITILPILLLAGFFIFLMRQAQGAGNQAFSFGKSRARVFTGDKPTVT
ncbi:MAG: ATP-dependent zinc metalloprotease FtsH, partial [Anaerolineae bacterium]